MQYFVYWTNKINLPFIMKNINPLGMFDEHFLLEKLTKLNDPLVKLEAHIDWKIFEPILAAKKTKK